jgi:hypothetical protein
LVVQVNVSRRQNESAAHSSSFQQLCGLGMQTAPDALQTPERQTLAALFVVHGPDPSV